MVEAEIWGLADSSDGSMIFIRPLDEEVAVPIFIGRAEAQAILAGFSEAGLPRPLGADLMINLARHAGFVLTRAEINNLKDNTFYARLIFSTGSESGGTGVQAGENDFVLDSRPSDALALAIRAKSPIFIARKVVAEAGIPTEDLNPPNSDEHRLLLQAELDEAVETEDYERACRLRDMIIQLDKK
ncbi:MAG: bifunctional nuclease family protein [Treponema sp.]|jgi:bifunctional DNase/RNase|nr:bifunctional nuclease family protein [Treponema sp.]